MSLARHLECVTNCSVSHLQHRESRIMRLRDHLDSSGWSFYLGSHITTSFLTVKIRPWHVWILIEKASALFILLRPLPRQSSGLTWLCLMASWNHIKYSFGQVSSLVSQSVYLQLPDLTIKKASSRSCEIMHIYSAIWDSNQVFQAVLSAHFWLNPLLNLLKLELKKQSPSLILILDDRITFLYQIPTLSR